jgi:aminomethyltransferase
MMKTSLNQWHAEHGATMTDFNGWHMPLYYKGITQEHLHTREKAGLFDLGHMGRVFVRGDRAREFVNYLTPARVSQAQQGEVHYSFLLRPDGSVIDDITIYYDRDELLLVINAGNRERDLDWIKGQAASFGEGIEIEDRGVIWGMIALQGPLSTSILEPLLGPEIAPLGYYHFARIHSDAFGEMIVSRTGYTGEDGYEIYLPTDNVQPLWEAIMAAKPEGTVQPIGLGARDSLRLEAAMPLYGHELDDNLTPLHAGLGKFVDLEKGEFIGRDALLQLKQAGGPDKKLIGFEMAQRGPIPRQGFTVLNPAGEPIGTVTSGIFSPTLQKTVGLAYISKEHSTLGNSISIDIRGRALPATIIKRPFYRRQAA